MLIHIKEGCEILKYGRTCLGSDNHIAVPMVTRCFPASKYENNIIVQNYSSVTDI